MNPEVCVSCLIGFKDAGATWTVLHPVKFGVCEECGVEFEHTADGKRRGVIVAGLVQG